MCTFPKLHFGDQACLFLEGRSRATGLLPVSPRILGSLYTHDVTATHRASYLNICFTFANNFEAHDATINQQLISSAHIIDEIVIVHTDHTTLAVGTWSISGSVTPTLLCYQHHMWSAWLMKYGSCGGRRAPYWYSTCATCCGSALSAQSFGGI